MKLQLIMLLLGFSGYCTAQEMSAGQLKLNLKEQWTHSHINISEQLVSPTGDRLLLTVLAKGTVGYEAMQEIVFEHVLLDSARYEKSRLIKAAATYQTSNGYSYRLIQFKKHGVRAYELGGSINFDDALVCFTYTTTDNPERAAAQINDILSGIQISPKVNAAF